MAFKLSVALAFLIICVQSDKMSDIHDQYCPSESYEVSQTQKDAWKSISS